MPMRSASRRPQPFRPRLERLEDRLAPSGSHWIPVNSGTTNTLNDIDSLFSTILAVGDAGTILSSTDGATWQARNSGTTQALLGIYGYYVVGAGGTILQTPDNGTTWEPRNSGTT